MAVRSPNGDAEVTEAADTLAADLAEWFRERPLWVQDAARRLLENGDVGAKDLEELLILCKAEAGVPVDTSVEITAVPPGEDAFASKTKAFSLRLASVSDLVGMNALGPRKPLQFGDAPLTIVYGTNGSGKSGYMRVLKHVCGARAKGDLLPNVFDRESPAQSCKISYSKDGVAADCEWTPNVGVHPDLRAVSVYDTECASVHVNQENQVSFEPLALRLIRRLVEISDEIAHKLDAEVSALVARLPQIPKTYATMAAGQWYAKIEQSISHEEIEERCRWEEADQERLNQLRERAAQANPAEAALALRKKLTYLQAFSSRLASLRETYSDEKFTTLVGLRGDAATKRQAAEVDARAVFADAPLGGIGTESWRLLWQQARNFSEAETYTAHEFPHVSDGALCVLCQQPLSPDATARLSRFEAFVKGGLEREAREAGGRLEDYLTSLCEVPSAREVEEQLDLCGIDDQSLRTTVAKECIELRDRAAAFVTAMDPAQIPPVTLDTGARELVPLLSTFEARAKELEEDAATGKKAELELSIAELEARHWINTQREAIATEISRLRLSVLLQSARRLTNTQALSAKTSALAESLVTAAYKSRFETELKTLGGSRIKVSVDKTRAAKGRAWHKVRLVGASEVADAQRVLSEGEFRVVSLAAYFADVEGQQANTPVVIDDPVTSLDQDFEEATCARLVALSATRQVIVFTHRVSLLCLLESTARARDIECHVVSLHHEPWGSGEPGDAPHSVSKPSKAVNALRDHRVPNARKVLEAEGGTAYREVAKGICSEIRIVVERIVELELCAGVIERFRREVKTMGKLAKLSVITPEDCAYIDALMTKYSRYEHSQPGEAPVALPEPDELEADLTELREWMDGFSDRQKAA